MIFVVYAHIGKQSIRSVMGEADYSYFFVLKRYLPILETLGQVIVISDPELELSSIFKAAKILNKKCVFLQFSPPHKAYIDDRFKSLCIFAWEYTTIPTDAWGGNKSNDWRYTLGKHNAAITHSAMAVDAVKNAMGDNFPIISVPAPLWDSYKDVPVSEDKEINFHGLLFDSEIDDIDTYNKGLAGASIASQQVYLGEIVYSSVFCPTDGRKNWIDILTAYCYAFKDIKNTTLVLKLIHGSEVEAMGEVLSVLQKNVPLNCRVVVIAGYLSSNAYRKLISATTYIVNSSYGEGQCLPLMEFMSSGVPAIAPNHTAMNDYVTVDTGYVVSSAKEWTHWPHDPRILLKTMRFRLNWQSLKEAYVNSYHVYFEDKKKYNEFKLASMASLEGYCGSKSAEIKLKNFFSSITQVESTRLSSATKLNKLSFSVVKLCITLTSIERHRITCTRWFKFLDHNARKIKRSIFN